MKRHSAFVLLVLALAGTGLAHAQSQPRNGYWWSARSSEFKLGFVAGYVEAEVNVYDRMAWKCLADKNGGTIPEKYPGDEAFKACAESGKAFDFNSVGFGQMTDGLDQFYKDFQNKAISIVPAISYVRDQLKGKPTKELENDLALLRQQASSK
jgi:hypothetical protein